MSSTKHPRYPLYHNNGTLSPFINAPHPDILFRDVIYHTDSCSEGKTIPKRPGLDSFVTDPIVSLLFL